MNSTIFLQSRPKPCQDQSQCFLDMTPNEILHFSNKSTSHQTNSAQTSFNLTQLYIVTMLDINGCIRDLCSRLQCTVNFHLPPSSASRDPLSMDGVDDITAQLVLREDCCWNGFESLGLLVCTSPRHRWGHHSVALWMSGRLALSTAGLQDLAARNAPLRYDPQRRRTMSSHCRIGRVCAVALTSQPPNVPR